MLKKKILNIAVLLIFATSIFLISGCSASRNGAADDLSSAPLFLDAEHPEIRKREVARIMKTAVLNFFFLSICNQYVFV